MANTDVIFRWLESSGDMMVLMAGPYEVGTYKLDGLPQPVCHLPGVQVDRRRCEGYSHARAMIEDAVTEWFKAVLYGGAVRGPDGDQQED